MLVHFVDRPLDRARYVLQNPHNVSLYVQYIGQNTQNFVTWNHTLNYRASFLADQGFVGPEAYTGVLISPQPDQEGNKLQQQKILMFIYPIYNHNWRNNNIIYIYIYVSRLASNKIHQEIGWTKNLPAPQYNFWGPLYEKEYKIRYKREYLEPLTGTGSLSFKSHAVNLPLLATIY